jgi:seryl-tRNA synthetase
MLDIKLIRTETEKVKAALARRKEVVDIDALLELDNKRRELLYEVEQLKSKQNETSKQIPALKKEGKDVTPIFAEMKLLSAKIAEIDAVVKEYDEKVNEMMLRIPNLPNPTVPDGDTDEDNVEVRKFLEPTKFDFEPKAHWDVGADLGILDAPTAAKVTGTRFTFYKGLGSRLERSIINFFLDISPFSSVDFSINFTKSSDEIKSSLHLSKIVLIKFSFVTTNLLLNVYTSIYCS